MSTLPPYRRGPNPFLILGIVVVGTIAFFSLAEKRKHETRDRPRAFPSPLTPPIDAEKVERPPRRVVE
jgi:hypothetical protein